MGNSGVIGKRKAKHAVADTAMTKLSLDGDHPDRTAPHPAALVEAMRSLGYTLEAAIADLVDNSISHGATEVRIQFDWAGAESTVSICDNGCGMTEPELIQAMRPGSHNPRAYRSPGDLGRFGLGLKTASFSQAGRLSVISRAAGHAETARVWDLAFITECNDWILLRAVSDIALERARWLSRRPSGTCVVWEKLDRLVGHVETGDEQAHKAFLEAADRVGKHLAMVFGEFLTGRNAIVIRFGNQTLKPWDPFLREHDATQSLPEESLGPRVKVQPYILPHHSRLTKQQFEIASGSQGWNAHQGFYIYRNKRLIVAGGWLSLGMTRDEHLKLARIRIDVGNDVDFDWKLDVRKSVASPPVALREQLRRIARATRDRAQEVYRHRGRKILAASPKDHSSVWEGKVMRGRTLFRINREHPIVQSLTADGDAGRAVEALLRLIEETIPLDSIYIRHSEAPKQQAAPFEDTNDRHFRKMLSELYIGMVTAGRSHAETIATLSALQSAQSRPHLIASLNESPPSPSELD
jgi:hypothetical protein